jgi:hypothetical protein
MINLGHRPAALAIRSVLTFGGAVGGLPLICGVTTHDAEQASQLGLRRPAQVGLPATPPDAPGLFRCAAPDAIGRVFRDTGMHDVAETDVHGFSEPASAKDYCT